MGLLTFIHILKINLKNFPLGQPRKTLKSKLEIFYSMNLKDKFIQTKFLILASLLSLAGISLLTLRNFEKHTEYLEKSNREVLGAIDKVASMDKSPKSLKTLEYKELSPDKSHEALVYQMRFDPLLYDDYYKEYFPNQKIIIVRDLDSQKEDVVFTGEERTNNPHWLGNEYIFFTSYCGTGCKGIYLVNTLNKETRQGVWAYMYDEQKNAWGTHVNDWFSQKFVLDGMISKVKSEVVGGQAYLIFEMDDNNGNFLGEKRFIFTGDGLKEGG